jgi:RNA polymerase sigma factor (sigma-70 family)
LLEDFLARRDEAAFEALVRRHGPMVLGVCRRLLKNEADAEDAFQATFLVLVRKAPSVTPRDLVGNWLYGVAYRTALKARAAAARRRAKEREVAAMPRPGSPDELWLRLQALLDREVLGLPDKYRAPLVLCDLEGHSRKQAARQLGWAEGTVASRLARGRVLLAKQFARHGLKLSGGALAAALAQDVGSACVPNSLVVSTVRAATAVAAALVPARVAALVEGVVQAMSLPKLKIVTAVLLVAAFVAGGALKCHVAAAGRSAPPKVNAPKSAAAGEKVGEVRRFEGHTDGAHWVVFSPDGKRALSCAAQPGMNDPVVRLWEVATGKELKQLAGHTERVEAVAFSPDGKRAASCGADQTIRLWDVDKGQVIRRFEGHGDNVYAVVFSRDGKRLLSGSEDCTMRLWDVDKGEEIRKFEGHSDAVRGVALSPDGRRALSAGWDNVVCLWDVDKGTALRSFDGHTNRVFGVAFSPDGKRAASAGGDQTVRLWDLEKGEEIRKFEGHAEEVYAVAFSPDGKRLLSGGEDKTVRLWDVAGGKELHSFTGHEGRVRGVAFSPDGRYALSASTDKTLRLWRLPK